MLSAFEWTMATRYLRARRQEGFISVIAGFSLLGIALGVATLIIVMAVMNGFRHELLSRILGLSGHVVVYGSGVAGVADYDALAERLRRVDHVRLVTPMVEGQAMASANNQATGALVRGVRGEDLRRRALVAEHMTAGSLERFGDGDGVVIGDRLAHKLGLRPGDRITLISPAGTPTAFGTMPRIRGYEVVGTFNVGMYEYDSTFVFMPLAAAQLYFRTGEAVTGLEVMVDDPNKLAAARRGLAEAVGTKARLYDWQQANSHFFTALQVERNVMFLILTLIILVAVFNIISSMIMLVKDKGHDIAILRTMGATRGAILRIFLIAGASVGVVGTAAGFVLGLAFARNIDAIRHWLEGMTGTELWSPEIRFLSQLPARVETVEVLSVVVMALALSFLATIYPAWRAARLDPVEALRYE